MSFIEGTAPITVQDVHATNNDESKNQSDDELNSESDHESYDSKMIVMIIYQFTPPLVAHTPTCSLIQTTGENK